jgi:hypothetical protein
MDPTLEGYEHGFALSDGEEEASGAQVRGGRGWERPSLAFRRRSRKAVLHDSAGQGEGQGGQKAEPLHALLCAAAAPAEHAAGQRAHG